VNINAEPKRLNEDLNMATASSVTFLHRPSIYKIVYRSYAMPTSDNAREAEIAEVLAVSRSWNSANDITGALLLSGTGYAQVLEGPPHAVKSLFGHIACDRRHHGVELLYSDYHSERDFGNWSMAVVGPVESTDIELASTTYKRNIVLADGADDIRIMLRWLLIDEPLQRKLD
jgi:hypothetical protein